MELDKKIKEKQKQLEEIVQEINKLQQTLQQKQVEALKLDGAITVLNELNHQD